MTPEEHETQATRMRGAVTRARLALTACTGTLESKLSLRRALDAAKAALRDHRLAFFALTAIDRMPPAMPRDEAERLAKWVNTHDTGISPPAKVVERSCGFVVQIRGQEVMANGGINTVTNEAHSYDDARTILGY